MERRSLSPVAQIAPPGRESLIRRLDAVAGARGGPSGNDVSLRVDISAQKELQHALQQAREAAETASQMKSQFLGNVSHELRTPFECRDQLRPTDCRSNYGPLGAPDLMRIRAGRYRGERHPYSVTLIDDLLDLARAEGGSAGGRREKRSSRLIATACRVLEPEAIANGIALTHAIGGDVSYKCVAMNPGCDRCGWPTHRQRHQIHSRGEPLQVQAACDGPALVRVSDTGIGMAAYFGLCDGAYCAGRAAFRQIVSGVRLACRCLVV